MHSAGTYFTLITGSEHRVTSVYNLIQLNVHEKTTVSMDFPQVVLVHKQLIQSSSGSVGIFQSHPLATEIPFKSEHHLRISNLSALGEYSTVLTTAGEAPDPSLGVTLVTRSTAVGERSTNTSGGSTEMTHAPSPQTAAGLSEEEEE